MTLIEKITKTDKFKNITIEDHGNMVWIRITYESIIGKMLFYQCYYSPGIIFCEPEMVDGIYKIIKQDLETSESNFLKQLKAEDKI